MIQNRWERIQELFAAALELAPEQRTAYVREKAEDTALRAEVLALLQAHEARGRLDSIADRLAATPAAGLPPVLSGRYRVERELGRGGMATVYLAHDQKHDRKVALKVLQPELARAIRAERFVREIRIAAQLTHPHIVPLHDSGEVEGILYYVMPYVEGESLRDRLSREKQLPVEDALRIARDVAAALSYAHSQGVVHRDIKPENILLAPGGEAVVADFGIARALTVAGGPTVSEVGVAVGTPAYMSPEQGSDAGEVDGRSDIYSLGCVLYEMLAGHAPFSGATAQEVIARHALDPIPTLEAARPGVLPGLAQAVRKALAKRPVDRFAGADQFAAALTAPSVEDRRPRWMAYAALGLVALVAGSLFTRRLLVPAPEARPYGQSVAVLPFVNLSGEPANEYLSDGLSEELISTLAQIPGLRVPARTSSFYFKGKALPVRQIGESLRVAHVLEGTLRRVGDRLRINAQLIKVADGYHLWSETYNRELARGQEVLAVQEELARAIVEALPLERGVVAGTATAHRHTENPKAYDLYLRGRYLWNRGTPEALNRARDFFAAAIAEDSTYARAYSGLADTYDRLYVLRYVRWAEAHTRARAAAYRAVELDPQSAEAYTSRGRIRYILEWDWSGAESDLRQAITLNPGYALAHLWHGRLLVYLGRFTEGTRAASRAVELEPLSPQVLVQYARMLFQARQYERSVEQARKALELEVSPEAFQLLGETYTQQDQFDNATRAFRSALGLLGGRGRATRIMAGLGVVYARAGRRQEALKILDSLEVHGQAPPAPQSQSVAILHAALGQKDQAFAWLEKGLQEHDYYLALLRVDPFVDPLRSDPRFDALLKRVGL